MLLRYLLRALLLAVPLTAAVWALQKRKRPWVLVMVFYMTMLLSVTVLRDGRHLLDFWKIPHTAKTVQLTPIIVTLRQGRAGAWYLFYPIAINIFWFLPFGFLLKKLRPNIGLWGAVFCSLALSLGIEVLQWVLISGISDIDDVILNVLGGFWGRKLASYPQRC